jgi:hypothetical protein
MEELREALSVQKGDDEIQECNLMDAQEIDECCRGLVVWERSSDTVRFTHETVKKFLEKEQFCKLLLSSAEIALVCLIYLNFRVFEAFQDNKEFAMKRMLQLKFGSYAAQYWAVHTRGNAESCGSVQETVISLLQSESKRNSLLQMEAYNNSRLGDVSFVKGKTALHIIADKGLSTIGSVVLYGRPDVLTRYYLFSRRAK